MHIRMASRNLALSRDTFYLFVVSKKAFHCFAGIIFAMQTISSNIGSQSICHNMVEIAISAADPITDLIISTCLTARTFYDDYSSYILIFSSFL